jgi:hypothetical protein
VANARQTICDAAPADERPAEKNREFSVILGELLSLLLPGKLFFLEV